jgi:hypothetical protein
MWEPRRLSTPWASTACYRNSFTLPYNKYYHKSRKYFSVFFHLTYIDIGKYFKSNLQIFIEFLLYAVYEMFVQWAVFGESDKFLSFTWSCTYLRRNKSNWNCDHPTSTLFTLYIKFCLHRLSCFGVGTRGRTDTTTPPWIHVMHHDHRLHNICLVFLLLVTDLEGVAMEISGTSCRELKISVNVAFDWLARLLLILGVPCSNYAP